MRTVCKRISSLAVSALLLAAALLNTSTAVHAQTNVGRISGTVKDTSGAVVPGANVTVTNQGTGISRAATTDNDGFYLVTNLPIGDYSVLVEREGFGKAQKKDNSLVADGRLTVDFELAPGGVASEVTVTSAAGETVNDTSAEVSRVIDSDQVQDLATNGRNYMELTTLIPGAPLLTDDALDFMTSLSVNQPVNGNRGNTNNLTVDGGFNLDSGSNNSQINNVGLDFVQEVSIKTSNFSAEYGRSSGAAINVSTKSGTNQYHGSFYEYFRNEKLNANHFNNNAQGIFSDDLSRPGAKVLVPAGDPRIGKKVAERRPERYNNFGFSLGGPIFKNKLFFFGGMEWKIIRRVDSVQATLPTSAELAGDFSFRLRGRDGIVGTADDGVIRDPNNAQSTCRAPTVNSSGVVTTPAVRTGCFPGNRIPANRITTDGRAIANVFAQMAARAASFTDTPTSNNALFLEPNPFELRQEIVRIDYKPNDAHSIYGRFLHDFYNIIDPFGTLGIDSDLPTTPTQRDRPGYGIQLGHTWLVSPTFVNEFRVNAAWNAQRLIPLGDAWKRETYGFQFPELFGGGRFPDGIPRVAVSGFPAFEGPARALISPTTDIQASDNVTMPLGKHAFKFGGILIRNRKDQNARTLSLGSVSFSGSTSRSNSTQNALADALLGNFNTYSEFKFDPVGFFRFTQVEAYATDAWKVHPRLSLELGARYRFNQPMYTQQNILSNFDPRLYDPARAVTVANNGRVTVGPGQDRFNGLIRAGDGVPEDQVGRVPTANDPDVLRVPTGAPRGLYESSHVIEPRVGFAWSPFSNDRGKTAIRGGFGIFHDRPAGTEILFSLLGNPPYNSSASFENANLANPSSGTETALAAHGTVQAVDPDFKTPYTMSYSLTVQRELPWGLFAEVGYVGNQGRHLLRQPEINLPTFEQLRARALLPSSQQPNLNAIRPYKGYSSIRMRTSDANSNYNAMQVYVTKRRGDLKMTLSYTWSKALTDASGAGDNVDAGINPFDRRADHGPASFDRRHIIATTTAYRLPFFRRSHNLLGTVLGGWEISSVFRAQTGAPLTIFGDTIIGSDVRGDYTGLPLDPPSVEYWFNPDAFTKPPDTRPGNTSVGVLYGPGRTRLDLAMNKSVRFGERFRARLRVDAFNALNQASRTGVNTNLDSSGFGQVTGATSPRSIQVGVRFEF